MMPSWVSADPDHVFWMRVVLALAEGIWIPLAGFAGFLLFRWRERARLEEQTMADLRKLRFDTLAEVMNAWMAHYRAHIEARHLRGILEQAMAPSDIEQLRRLVAEAELREKQSVTVFTDLMMAKAMLPSPLARRDPLLLGRSGPGSDHDPGLATGGALASSPSG